MDLLIIQQQLIKVWLNLIQTKIYLIILEVQQTCLEVEENFLDQELWESNQEKVFSLEKAASTKIAFTSKNKKISCQINYMDKVHLLQMDLEEWELCQL